jgi:hypothetical protein
MWVGWRAICCCGGWSGSRSAGGGGWRVEDVESWCAPGREKKGCLHGKRRRRRKQQQQQKQQKRGGYGDGREELHGLPLGD